MLPTKVTPYPKEIQSLHTAEGFEKMFWLLYRSFDWKSREQCYEALEEDYEHYYGRRRYCEYNTFRNLMARRHKMRKR